MIQAFLDALISECPYALADTKKAKETAVDTRTLLATAIYEIEYHPSTLAILADQKALIKKGFLVDADIPQLTLRNMTDHCTKPMLDELAEKVRAQEASLVEVLAEPSPAVEGSKPAAPARETVIVNDEMLGRIEIDAKTAEVIRVVPDTDARGDVLVDDGHKVVVTDTETSKQSTIWGSW